MDISTTGGAHTMSAIQLFTALILFGQLFLSGCNGMFFVPERQLIRDPTAIDLKFRDVTIDVATDVSLHGWLLEGQEPVKGTIVFLHGNAQNISYHISAVAWLPAQHFNVFIYDYRGFGKSSGTATVENSIQDFPRIMRMLQDRIPQAEQRFIIYGQSLGGALAIAQLAQYRNQFPVEALVVDSAFSGFRRIASEKLQNLLFLRPLNGLLSRLFTDEPDLLVSIAAISPVPVLIVQGTADGIVPTHHARLLFEHAGAPKQLWLEPEARHIGSFARQPARDRLLAWLATVMNSDTGE